MREAMGEVTIEELDILDMTGIQKIPMIWYIVVWDGSGSKVIPYNLLTILLGRMNYPVYLYIKHIPTLVRMHYTYCARMEYPW